MAVGEQEIDRQIIDGYTRIPQGDEFDVDEWGDLGKMVTALSIDSFRKLDDDERASGFERW